MHLLTFCGARLVALPSGAVHWPDQDALIVSDLHFGKAARLSSVGGAALPPYDMRATLTKLDADIAATDAARVICLGDSLDFAELDTALPEDDLMWLARLQAGRRWDWIEGNHDPGPNSLGGTFRASLDLGGLTLRHIARAGARGELSGHYHPKACFHYLIISELNGFIALINFDTFVHSRTAIAREILNHVGIGASYKLIRIKA